MTEYKIDFKQLKSRVGIDNIAYALGYHLDRKAGVGRYIELVLGDGADRRDTIIVSHPNDKAAQTFFRRDGSKGDVVTFIRENLDDFFVSGKDEWQKVAKVMARFANMPEPEYREDRDYVRSVKLASVFDSSRYEVKPLDTGHIPPIFKQRGLSDDTVRTLAPFISLVRDSRNAKFDRYNIGFPYTASADGQVKGFEIRGYGGYKSKAAGTDSSTAAWVADLSGGKGDLVRSVFFCESAFDAMAFYQFNKERIGTDCSLVSLGGTFSDRQVTNVMERFPAARAFDCFDNDLAGRIYGLRMMSLLEGIPIKINRKDDGIQVEAKGKSFVLTQERSFVAQLGEQLSIRYRMGRWPPPRAFKDWNDCVMNKPLEVKPTPNKAERDNNLAGRRSGGIKI